VIPNWNDGEDDLDALTDWVAAVDPDMPLHFSRYHPDYKLSEPPTPTDTLYRAREKALTKLHYVYVGNIWGGDGESTVCPKCGKVVVERSGFAVCRISVKRQQCEFCGAAVPITGT
jgi:pyruvate formate lyase activating enzyme